MNEREPSLFFFYFFLYFSYFPDFFIFFPFSFLKVNPDASTSTHVAEHYEVGPASTKGKESTPGSGKVLFSGGK
jgi:hypothetical protein